MEAKVSDLLGKTMISVVNEDNGELIFKTTTGEVYVMDHDQDCCECVLIDDIVGELSDLVGAPILMAEEVNSAEEPAKSSDDESFTWTFYKFATMKGYVTIKWYGTSNGYYSEKVDFKRIS